MLKCVQIMLKNVQIGVPKIFVRTVCWELYRGKIFVKLEVINTSRKKLLQ